MTASVPLSLFDEAKLRAGVIVPVPRALRRQAPRAEADRVVGDALHRWTPPAAISAIGPDSTTAAIAADWRSICAPVQPPGRRASAAWRRPACRARC